MNQVKETVISQQEMNSLVDALIPMLDAEQDMKWDVGDLLVSRIHGDGVRTPSSSHTNNGANGWYATVARMLAAKGRDVPEETLRNRYRVALALPPEARFDRITWYTHYTIVIGGPAESAPQRMAKYVAAMKADGRLPSKRSAQEWLGVKIAPNEGTPSVRKFIEEHPEIVVDAVADNPAIARAVAANPASSVAVSRERNLMEDERGARSPAELDKERARKRLENGPTLIEILELGMEADKLAVLARKFQTPVDGPSPYSDNARIQIEAAIARIRASVQHVEDVMNGNVDTRIPDDISTLVSE